jgi:hypothetical protein
MSVGGLELVAADAATELEASGAELGGGSETLGGDGSPLGDALAVTAGGATLAGAPLAGGADEPAPLLGADAADTPGSAGDVSPTTGLVSVAIVSDGAGALASMLASCAIAGTVPVST